MKSLLDSSIMKTDHDAIDEKFQMNIELNHRDFQSIKQNLITKPTVLTTVLKENPIYNRSSSYDEKANDFINKNIYKLKNSFNKPLSRTTTTTTTTDFL
jgi:hypothetical protein